MIHSKPSTRLLRGLSIAATALLVFAVGHASAQKPADQEIAAAVYDLDRIAKELPGLTPARRANIKRVERSLQMAEKRLNGSSNQGDPSWQAAKARLDEYKARIDTLKAPPAQAAQPPARATGAPVPGPATSAEAARRPQAAGNAAAAASATVPGSASAPSAARPADASAAPPARPAAPAGLPSYELTKLNKLARDLASTRQDFAKLDPKVLHGEREQKNWRGRIVFFRKGIGRYAAYEADPRVAELKRRIDAFEAEHAAVEKKSLAAYAALGSVPAGVAKIQDYYRTAKPPAPLDPPYTPERAQAWAGYIKAFAQQAAVHAKWLQTVLATTNEFGREVRNTLNGTIGNRANGAIKRAIADTHNAIDQPVLKVRDGSPVDFVSKLKGSDSQQIRNNLLGDGQYEKLVADIRAALEALENRRIIDRALGQPESPDVARTIAALGEKRKRIDALFETVLGEVRMPRARSTDPKLIAAAEQALARFDPKPRWARMVVNTEATKRTQARAWWSGGAVTIADYKWTEFQVATAEEVDGQYFIYYNNIHYYTSGSARTPLNKWIVNGRFQSNRILKENVGK